MRPVCGPGTKCVMQPPQVILCTKAGLWKLPPRPTELQFTNLRPGLMKLTLTPSENPLELVGSVAHEAPLWTCMLMPGQSVLLMASAVRTPAFDAQPRCSNRS